MHAAYTDVVEQLYKLVDHALKNAIASNSEDESIYAFIIFMRNSKNPGKFTSVFCILSPEHMAMNTLLSSMHRVCRTESL